MPAVTGYHMADGRFARLFDASFNLAGTPRTATFNSASIELGDLPTMCIDLTVSAASGTTPTLDVTIQTSKDNATWRTVASFAQKTGVSTERKSFTGCDRFVRANCVIGGTTPSFTFDITGEAK